MSSFELGSIWEEREGASDSSSNGADVNYEPGPV